MVVNTCKLKVIYMPRKRTIFQKITFVIFSLFGLIIIFFVMSALFRAFGFSENIMLIIFVSILIGSFIDIPLFTKKWIYEGAISRTFSTKVCLNVGGALIPMGLSIYLLYNHTELLKSFFIAVLVIAVIVRIVSRAVPNKGFTIPLFIPPVVTIFVVWYLPGTSVVLAFASGVFGVLLGLDIMNINRIKKLNAAKVTFGGAGTFDAVFITGLASLFVHFML